MTEWIRVKEAQNKKSTKANNNHISSSVYFIGWLVMVAEVGENFRINPTFFLFRRSLTVCEICTIFLR